MIKEIFVTVMEAATVVNEQVEDVTAEVNVQQVYYVDEEVYVEAVIEIVKD